jgi:hypothetical protein
VSMCTIVLSGRTGNEGEDKSAMEICKPCSDTIKMFTG